MLSVIGTYSVRNSIFDIWVLLGAGVLGYFFNKMKFQLAPLVVGLILGPNIEKHFREALFLSQGDPWIYVESPIAVAIWLLVAAVLIAGCPGHPRTLRETDRGCPAKCRVGGMPDHVVLSAFVKAANFAWSSILVGF